MRGLAIAIEPRWEVSPDSTDQDGPLDGGEVSFLGASSEEGLVSAMVGRWWCFW